MLRVKRQRIEGGLLAECKRFEGTLHSLCQQIACDLNALCSQFAGAVSDVGFFVINASIRSRQAPTTIAESATLKSGQW